MNPGQLVSVSVDSIIKWWSASDGEFKCLHTFTGVSAGTVAFSHDGEVLAGGGKDKTIKLWSTKTFESLGALKGHCDTISCLKFNPTNAAQLASGSWDKTIKLWSVSDGQCQHTFGVTFTNKWGSLVVGHNDHVNTVDWSPDGKILVSGSSDKTIIIWHMPGTNVQSERAAAQRVEQELCRQREQVLRLRAQLDDMQTQAEAAAAQASAEQHVPDLLPGECRQGATVGADGASSAMDPAKMVRDPAKMVPWPAAPAWQTELRAALVERGLSNDCVTNLQFFSLLVSENIEYDIHNQNHYTNTYTTFNKFCLSSKKNGLLLNTLSQISG
jgi:hypothetical protein